MSDQKDIIGQEDRDRLDVNESYEVQHFVEQMQIQRPNSSKEEIRAALKEASETSGRSSMRDELTQEVLKILDAK